jgi:hypothetical protein
MCKNKSLRMEIKKSRRIFKFNICHIDEKIIMCYIF